MHTKLQLHTSNQDQEHRSVGVLLSVYGVLVYVYLKYLWFCVLYCPTVFSDSATFLLFAFLFLNRKPNFPILSYLRAAQGTQQPNLTLPPVF